MIHWEAGNCAHDRGELSWRVDDFPECHLMTFPKERHLLLETAYRHREAPDGFYDFQYNSWCCPYCNKSFSQPQQLTAHLRSPHHDPKVFTCPNQACGMRFTVLSGLYQHVENSSCRGSAECLRRLWDGLVGNYGVVDWELWNMRGL